MVTGSLDVREAAASLPTELGGPEELGQDYGEIDADEPEAELALDAAGSEDAL